MTGIVAIASAALASVARAQTNTPPAPSAASVAARRDTTPIEREVLAAWTIERAGKTEEAEKRYREAIAAAHRANDGFGLALGEARLGLLFWSHSRQDSAVAHLLIAKKLRLEQGDVVEYARVLNGLGAAYYQNGLYEPAIQAFTESQSLRRELHDTLGLARTLTNIGKTYQDWGQLTRARQKLREAVAVASRSPAAAPALGYAYNSLALAEIDAGEFDSAAVSITRSVAAYELPGGLLSRADSIDMVGITLTARGALLLRRGQHVAARVVLDSAYASAVARGSVRGQALSLLQLGECAQAMGDLPLATKQFAQSLTLAESVGQRVITLAAVRHLALAEEANGRMADALRHLKRYQALRDTVFDQDAAQRVASREAEAEVEQLQVQQRAQLLTISRQRVLVFGVLTVLAIVSAFVTLLVRASRAERKRAEDLATANGELARLNDDLRNAMTEVRTLSGLIPICSNCKRVRDDHGYWQAVETWVTRHSEAQFSHSICQSCGPVLYGSLWTPEGEQK